MTKPQTPFTAPPEPRRVFIAFTTASGLTWLRWFCGPRFQHCSVHIQDQTGWTSIEGLAGYTEIIRHEVTSEFNLPRMLRDQGMIVVETELRRDEKTKRALFPAIYSCVELAKRILGMNRPLIITPGQLYGQIIKMKGGAA